MDGNGNVNDGDVGDTNNDVKDDDDSDRESQDGADEH